MKAERHRLSAPSGNKDLIAMPGAGMKKPKKEKIRIMVVDDHPFVRHGIARLINAESDLVVCSEAGDYRQALSGIEAVRPDFAVVDLSLKDVGGIELVKDIKKSFPSLPILVLSMHDEALYAERVIRAGARGYIMKHEGTEVLIKAIRAILSGKIYVNPEMTSRLITKKTGLLSRGEGADMYACLSDRELQVFELIGRGRTTKEIADALCLSIKTIETYRQNLKIKLKLNTQELLQHAVLWVKSPGVG